MQGWTPVTDNLHASCGGIELYCFHNFFSPSPCLIGPSLLGTFFVSFSPFPFSIISPFFISSNKQLQRRKSAKILLFFISLDYVYRYLCWVWLIVLDWPLDINYVMYSILLLWVDHVGFVVLVPEWDDLGPSVHPILVEEILKNASRNFLYLLNFWEAWGLFNKSNARATALFTNWHQTKKWAVLIGQILS